MTGCNGPDPRDVQYLQLLLEPSATQDGGLDPALRDLVASSVLVDVHALGRVASRCPVSPEVRPCSPDRPASRPRVVV